MTITPETGYPAFEYMNFTTSPTTAPSDLDAFYIFFAAVLVILMILGIVENGLVIWTAGFKVKKSVNTTWYLGLAVSDFIFLLFLPFDAISAAVNECDVMSKFSSFITSFNMFSSIFLLVIMSVDRCVVIMFPVWAQDQRTVRKASVIVMLACIISAVLSMPLTFLYDAQSDVSLDQVVYNFIFGFMVPFLTIIICYFFIIRKLRKASQKLKFKKPFKIMTSLIAVFLICWLPPHVFDFMKINNEENKDALQTEEVVASIFVCVESFLSPLIYIFMRNDFMKHVKRCVTCKT